MSDAAEIPKLSKGRQLAVGVVIAALMWGGIKAVGWIADDPEPPATVAEISPHIVETNVVDAGAAGRTLSVFFLKRSMLSEGTWLFDVSGEMMKISREIVRWWPDAYSEVLFFVRVPTRDNYGKDGDALALKLRWTATDLKRIEWKNITNWNFLALAEVADTRPLGRRLAAAFCADETNRGYSGRFCGHF